MGKIIGLMVIMAAVSVAAGSMEKGSGIKRADDGRPMDKYEQRAGYRWYGKEVEPAEAEKLPCGFPFSGFHTGDDLEELSGEEGKELAVKAIAEGVVKMVEEVRGYGGLVVVEHELKGQPVTAYYGHVNLESVTKRAGEKVEKGEKLADLGEDCSRETDGERKHLHFAIRRGREIDVRGYVQTNEELKEWLNPREVMGR